MHCRGENREDERALHGKDSLKILQLSYESKIVQRTIKS